MIFDMLMYSRTFEMLFTIKKMWLLFGEIMPDGVHHSIHTKALSSKHNNVKYYAAQYKMSPHTVYSSQWSTKPLH